MVPMPFTNIAVYSTMAGNLNIGPISKFQNLSGSLWSIEVEST